MSVKEMLYETIQGLNDEQVQAILEMAQRMRQKNASATWMRLARNPAFKLPKDGFKRLPRIKPVEGTGILASQLLIQDRR